MKPQTNDAFYRKFIGLTQCSAEKPLNLTISDDTVTLKKGLENIAILTLSHSEFLEWSSHKILNKAGVKINDQEKSNRQTS